jgi:serine/threonine protein kinase/tetratricopeptide (TPR) repeat protein
VNTITKSAKGIFLEAVNLAAEEQAAFLDQACATDTALRRQVGELLDAHRHGGSFLAKPAVEPLDEGYVSTASDPGSKEAVSPAHRPASDRGLKPDTAAHLGPYRLLQQIGEGGMGTVYIAEQEYPVKRRVALKVIKPGMDSAQVLRRFEAERQALALMDHTCIAKVLDAGTSPGGPGEISAGRPYFVMELVKGEPITKYCDTVNLPIRDRLMLFIQVCQAIQHAHQKGIIHRDIKASNILVCMQDGKPVPKVIDFGVAKALHQKLSERTMYTEIGSVVGTLEYMSPEQAELSAMDIDTRADVYGLGVLLYELLTGSTPLDKKRLQLAGYSEAVRLIKEEEPPRPSTRLSQSQAVLASLAARRRTEPARLAKEVQGELDWIAMKALEKDRTRRYESASSLARDVERYLTNEPVEACPPSAGYRVKKFVYRNRGPVLAASGLVLLLIAGIVGTTLGLVRAKHALDEAIRAREAEAKQTQIAVASEANAHDAAREAKRLQKLAEDQERDTTAILDFVQDYIFAAGRPGGQDGGLGREVTLSQTLRRALPFVATSFSHHPLVEARVRMTLGISYLYLGQAKIAVDQFHTARALYSKHLGANDKVTLGVMNSLANGYRYLGRFAEARKLYEETLKRQEQVLPPDDPDTLITVNNLAVSLQDAGHKTEALALFKKTLERRKAKLGDDHQQTLASMSNLANCIRANGRAAEALKLHQEVLALQGEKLGRDHPDTLITMNNLGINLQVLNQHEEAIRIFEKTLELRKVQLAPDHPDTLRTMGNLANSVKAVGRYEEASKLYLETFRLQSERLGLNHPDTFKTTYNVACYYAVTVPLSPNRDKTTAQAMDWLRKAIDAGFHDMRYLKGDSDLDVLRNRADFKQLLASLESRKNEPRHAATP